jgi:hypothetical protein
VILARENPDGTLADFSPEGCRGRTPEDVELDEMPLGPGPWRRDPGNLRTAILHALATTQAMVARRNRALRAEIRMAGWQRIRARLVAAGRPTVWVDAEIAAANQAVLDAIQGE